MDILSLTHNVRVGQEVEPRGIKPPERNLGKEVREADSPPTRGAPSSIRADRKEASSAEQKPLQQALDLLEAELPIEPSFRDLALNKKIRPDSGLENALSEFKLQVEFGKPKVKDLLAAIGVEIPLTLNSRSLANLQQTIAEKIDGLSLPAPIERLLKALQQAGNIPVHQAPEITDAAPDGRTPSIDSRGRTGISKTGEYAVPVPDSDKAPLPGLTAPRRTKPTTPVITNSNVQHNGTFLQQAFGAPGPPKPVGMPEIYFREIPRPGVPDDLIRVPLKIASELGASKIEVQVARPQVNLETMASILNKGLSLASARALITEQAPVPVPDNGSPHESKLTSEAPRRPVFEHGQHKVPTPHSRRPSVTSEGRVPVTQASLRPRTASSVPTTVSNPTVDSGGTLITPDILVDRKPWINSRPAPQSVDRALFTSSGRQLSANGSRPIGSKIGPFASKLPEFDAPITSASDVAGVLASNVSEASQRATDGSALRLAATSAVASVHESIIDHIQEIAASQGRGRVVIRLQPEELGSITVSVRSFGQRVEADIRASNDAVREALVANRGDLVMSVEGKGLSLDSFNVGQEAGSDAQTSEQQSDKSHDMRREFERFANVSRAFHQDVPVTAAAPWLSPSTEVVDYTV